MQKHLEHSFAEFLSFLRDENIVIERAKHLSKNLFENGRIFFLSFFPFFFFGGGGGECPACSPIHQLVLPLLLRSQHRDAIQYGQNFLTCFEIFWKKHAFLFFVQGRIF